MLKIVRNFRWTKNRNFREWAVHSEKTSFDYLDNVKLTMKNGMNIA